MAYYFLLSRKEEGKKLFEEQMETQYFCNEQEEPEKDDIFSLEIAEEEEE